MMNGTGIKVQLRLNLDRFLLEIDFESQAKSTGIFGSSGCGKTSLLESVAGLRRDATGLVKVGDEVWLDSSKGICLAPQCRRVGYVPFDALLFPHLNMKDNLLFGAVRARKAGKDPEKLLLEVCHTLSIEHLLGRSVGTLSAGERQRAALGRALCSSPSLLLLDEPMSALDVPMRRKLLPFLRKVRDEVDIPILFVSHDPTEMQSLCSQVVVLKDGKIGAFGPAIDVLRDPVLLSSLPTSVENTLGCVIEESDGDLGVVLVGRSTRIYTRHRDEEPGQIASISIRARDILLARGCPEAISARNRIAADVVGIREGGGTSLVVLRLHGEDVEMLVETTHRAIQDLGVIAGARMNLIFKASSCTVV